MLICILPRTGIIKRCLWRIFQKCIRLWLRG